MVASNSPGSPINAPALATIAAVFGAEAGGFLGTPIPLSAGKRIVASVPLWASAIRTISATDRRVDFAVGFGYPLVPENDLADRLALRVWAEGTKIVDVDEGDPDITFTLYNGTESQTPDPTIAAAMGADFTPAFRGMIYAVFTDFPLGPLGLFQIPRIRFEFEEEILFPLVSTGSIHIWLNTFPGDNYAWALKGPANQPIISGSGTTLMSGEVIEIFEGPAAEVFGAYSYIKATHTGVSDTTQWSCSPLVGLNPVVGNGQVTYIYPVSGGYRTSLSPP